jgi:ankyrin repeat protein
MPVPAEAYPLHLAIQQRDLQAATRLIARGHDLNALDNLGMTPLHWAVYGGYIELVRALLEAGADPNRKSTHDTTALWHAEDDFGMHEIAAVLRTHGAAKRGRITGRLSGPARVRVRIWHPPAPAAQRRAVSWTPMLSQRVSFTIGAAAGIVAATAVSQPLLYERLVVPRLSGLSGVPLVWWLGLALPVLLVALSLGWMARSWSQSFAVAGLAAVGSQAYLHWAAASGRPGLHKSLAIEAPLDHWTVGVLAMFLLLSLPIVLARIGHESVRRSKAAS